MTMLAGPMTDRILRGGGRVQTNADGSVTVAPLAGKHAHVTSGNVAVGSILVPLAPIHYASVAAEEAGFAFTAKGMQLSYGRNTGVPFAGFTGYDFDGPVLTLKTPNGLYGTGAGVTEALAIIAHPWLYDGGGVAISFGGSTAKRSRIVHYGNNSTDGTSRLQLHTAGDTSGGLWIESDGRVTVGPKDSAFHASGGPKFQIKHAPTASASYGLVSIGTGPFDGSTAGFFTGHASGTVLAVNAASGYAGDLMQLAIAGASKLKVNVNGRVTSGADGFFAAGAAPVDEGANIFFGMSAAAGADVWFAANKGSGYGMLIGTRNNVGGVTAGIIRMVTTDDFRIMVNNTTYAVIVDSAGRVSTVNKISPGTDAGAVQTACGLYAGSGAPNNANGADGDIYFRSDGGALTTMYQRRAGTWVGIV